MTTKKKPGPPEALPVLYRTYAIELEHRSSDSSEGQADDRIPVTLSSETPVERWFGMEILDHSKGAVDLSRAAGGLPLLYRHGEHIGVIEDVELTADRKIRGMARFSSRPRAQEIRQDVLDGILRATSCGYRVLEMKLEKSEKGKRKGDVYRATRWQLMEGSLEPIPADTTVGAYRSAAEGDAHPVRILTPAEAPVAEERTVDEETTTAAPNGGAPQVRVTADNEADQRAVQIIDLCTGHGIAERAAEFIRAGKTLGEVKDVILAEARRGLKPIDTTAPSEPDVSPRERRAYSLGRAILAAQRGDWRHAGYERELSEELGKQLGRSATGFYVPTGELSSRTLNTGAPAAGGDTVFTQAGSFIELLRNKSVILGLGPMRLTGLRGNVALPRQTAAGDAHFRDELPADDVPEGQMGFDRVELSPKNVLATQSYTKQLFAQSEVAIDALMREDLSTIIALLYDRSCLHGGNGITGIYSAAGVNAVAFGGAISFGKVVDMEAAIEADNAALAGLAYVTTPEIKGRAKQTQIFEGTSGAPLWAGSADAGEMNGYKAISSNQVRKDLGAENDEHGLIFGAWSQAIVADWGAVDITVDPYSKAKRGIVEITAHWLCDFALRHPEAFAKATGLTAGA